MAVFVGSVPVQPQKRERKEEKKERDRGKERKMRNWNGYRE